MATYVQKQVQVTGTPFIGQDIGIGHREYLGTDGDGFPVWQVIVPTDGGEITVRMGDFLVLTDSGPIAVKPADFAARYELVLPPLEL